ncbi:hypothetical protein [Corynebacterium sp. HMSC034H07]|uniref:hypothetical protein n=1 Tax=Corynebacterium sp. HMSC034H07 TaxID=1739512 RepID=UPI001E572B37|nr:hypothetical protein [Corynebacterium sp. HMSC034H07]
MTTLHRISVPADAEALVFPDPYRSNVELTESMSTVDVRIPAHSAVTYSFQSGELKYPDPHNAHGAGPQASLLSGDSVDQTLWPPRSPEVIADLPGARLSIDRKVFGRRCTARLDDRGADTTVVFLDGDDWIHLHDLTGALDRAVTEEPIYGSAKDLKRQAYSPLNDEVMGFRNPCDCLSSGL